MQNVERRFITGDIRCMGDAGCDDSNIEGMAIAYNSVSSPGSLPFRERIAPGALARSLKNEDILCCFNHNPSLLLGRTSAKTLKLVDTPQGLRFRCDLPNTTYARDLKTSIARRDVTGCSFTFVDPEDVWSDRSNPAGPLRTITNMRCIELGPVSAPVYTATTVEAARALMFPNGVPQGLSTHLIDPNASEDERRLMRAQLALID